MDQESVRVVLKPGNPLGKPPGLIKQIPKQDLPIWEKQGFELLREEKPEHHAETKPPVGPRK